MQTSSTAPLASTSLSTAPLRQPRAQRRHPPAFGGLLACLLGNLVAGLGCGPTLTVSDRDDVARDRESLRIYATGAAVSFSMTSNSVFVDADDLEVTSSDQSIFVVDDGNGDVVQILTLQAGSAELVFRHKGDVVDSRRVEVHDPVRAEFRLEARVENDDDLVPPAINLPPPLRTLRGRQARVVVHLFDDDDKELFGQAISAVGIDSNAFSAALEAEGPNTALVLATGASATSATLHLAIAGGILPLDVPLIGTDVDQIERLLLKEGGDDGRRGSGLRSVVMAHAENAAGQVLLGAPGWQLEGENVGISDAVDYRVGFAVPAQSLVARLGPVDISRKIYAEPGSVSTTESCMAGGLPAPVLLAILAWRRRRRPSPGRAQRSVPEPLSPQR